MGDGLALLPVIARLLELSPEEVEACRVALRKAGVAEVSPQCVGIIETHL